MRRQYLVHFRLFCRWSLLTGFHVPHVQIYRYLCGIFSRWHFNPWTVCFPGLLLPSGSSFPQSMHYTFSSRPRLIIIIIIIQRQLVRRRNMAWVTTRAPINVKTTLLDAVRQFKQICFETVLEGSDGVRWPDVDWQAVPRFWASKTKTKTKCSRPRSRLSFLSSRRLETKTLVSRTTSLIRIRRHSLSILTE